MMDECPEDRVTMEGLYCPAVNDSIMCWPQTPANTTVYQPCPFRSALLHLKAQRTCRTNGTWYNYTDYSDCLKEHEDIPDHPVSTPYTPTDHQVRLYIILKNIYFVTSIISLVFLLITLFIFCYFRSLQCNRITIHKHLVTTFIILFSVSLLQITSPSYRNVEWVCKTVIVVSKYSQMTNFAWMLVEGIYLHNRLAVSVFPSDAPFKLFYFIGWGLPLLITGLWAGLMSRFHSANCWADYSKTPLILIIAVPILLALVINSAFLVNIIRVLVVKLRTNNLVESRRMRKAIKATVVLLPLLGVTNLLFLVQPADGTVTEVHRVVNTILPASQGVFVSVLYCFMNSEVQNVIMKKWKRFRTNRAMNHRSRRQGSRTSTYFLSQSDAPASRRQTALSRSCQLKDKDYCSLGVLNEDTPRETRNGHATVSDLPFRSTQSLKVSTVPKASAVVKLKPQLHGGLSFDSDDIHSV